MRTLELTDAELWLVVKALEYFTDDTGLERFFSEYEVDQDRLGNDLKSLLIKLEMLEPPTNPTEKKGE